MNEDANSLPGPVEYAIRGQFRRRIREGEEEDALQVGPRKKAYVFHFTHHISSNAQQH
jgi:hypothetical protein